MTEPSKNTILFPFVHALFLKLCVKKTKGMRHFEITLEKPCSLTQC